MSLDIEKLKALARAADPTGATHLVTHYRNNANVKAEEAWRVATSPAAVLELIAENERLRTEWAAGAAAGGNTSDPHAVVLQAQADAILGFAQAMVDVGIVSSPSFMAAANRCADGVKSRSIDIKAGGSQG